MSYYYVVTESSVGLAALLYQYSIIAIALLGYHLKHGITSAGQTLGIVGTKYEKIYNNFSAFFGFGSTWVYFNTGLVRFLSEGYMTEFNLFSKAPNGELHTKWEEYKKSLKKLALEDANKYKVIVVGTGLRAHQPLQR